MNGTGTALERLPVTQWLTKDQASRALGISRETLDAWIRKKQLSTRKQPREGVRPLTLVDPEDVERLKSQRIVHALLPPEPQRIPNGLTIPQPKPFLELQAAADYSGLPRNLLRQLIKTGKLPGIRWWHLWYVARRDLEDLELGSGSSAAGA